MDKAADKNKFDNNVLGEKLRKLRKEKGVNQTEVATKTGIDRTSYSKYETGRVLPPISAIIKLADYYNVSIDYLCNRSPFSSQSVRTEYEERLLSLFRKADQGSQKDVLDYISGIVVGAK